MQQELSIGLLQSAFLGNMTFSITNETCLFSSSVIGFSVWWCWISASGSLIFTLSLLHICRRLIRRYLSTMGFCRLLSQSSDLLHQTRCSFFEHVWRQYGHCHVLMVDTSSCRLLTLSSQQPTPKCPRSSVGS